MTYPTTPYKVIALEGTEGSGKSTQADMLRDRLIERGQSAIVINELRHPIAKDTLDFLKRFPDDWEEALVRIHASRMQINQEVVAPAVERGTVVIFDRYYLTTYAMQVYALSRLSGEALFFQQLKEIHSPDLLLYYQILPEELYACLARVKGREENFSFDEEAYIQRFIRGYERGIENPDLFKGVKVNTISALGSIADVRRKTWDIVKKF